MTADTTHLQLQLRGGPADQHRISLNDLTTVAQGVQAAVRNVGAVLAGQPTGRGGRKLGWIEEATELVMVAPARQGSVLLDLELADSHPTLDVDAEIPDLGPAAVTALVDGIEKLTPGAPLPRGFDPGVLKALTSLSPVFSKGYQSLSLSVGENGSRRSMTITPECLGVVRAITQHPVRAPASVDGVLIAVDLAGDPLACRIDRPFLQSVQCYIPRSMREVVKDLIEREVHAEGEGEFDPGADDPKRLHVSELSRGGTSSIDRLAWRDHRPWQEHALRQGTTPLRTEYLPALFEDDEDLDRFLTGAHGQLPT